MDVLTIQNIRTTYSTYLKANQAQPDRHNEVVIFLENKILFAEQLSSKNKLHFVILGGNMHSAINKLSQAEPSIKGSGLVYLILFRT